MNSNAAPTPCITLNKDELGLLKYFFMAAASPSKTASGQHLNDESRAWLYLEHRVGFAELKKDEELLRSYRELGRSAIDALYDIGDDQSLELAFYVEERLKEKD